MNCAWCNAEPDGTDSHGICSACEEQFDLQVAWKQLNRIPSYIERNAAKMAEECTLFLEQEQAVVA